MSQKESKRHFAATLLRRFAFPKCGNKKNTFQIDFFLFLDAFRPLQLIAFKAECREKLFERKPDVH